MVEERRWCWRDIGASQRKTAGVCVTQRVKNEEGVGSGKKQPSVGEGTEFQLAKVDVRPCPVVRRL